MLWACLLILGGLAALTGGAELLVRGAASLALRLGMSPLVVGLTIVAMGTSMPELVVSAQGAWQGKPDIAIGNVIGSNIANIGIILGLTALICPVPCQSSVIRREVPLMIAATVLLAALAILGGQSWELSRLEGGLLFALAIAVTYWLYRIGRTEDHDADFEVPLADPKTSIAKDAVLIVVGIALLALGGNLLVEGAVELARRVGLSELTIGLTIVAVGTSMPELATSLVAALRRQADIAIGNVVGSNLYNILTILGISALLAPVGVDEAVLWRDLPVALAFAVACVPIMASGLRVSRWEGVALLLGYGGYVALLLATSSPPPG